MEGEIGECLLDWYHHCSTVTWYFPHQRVIGICASNVPNKVYNYTKYLSRTWYKNSNRKIFILAICFSRYKRWLNLSCFYFHLIIYIKFFIVLKKNFIIIKEVGHYAVLFFLHSPTNPDCCWLSRGWGLGRELRCLTDGQQAPTPAVEVNEDGPICPTQPPHWLIDLHSDVPHVGVCNLINKAIYL